MNVTASKLDYDGLSTPREAHFSPYADNGGNIVAVAGEDFAVIASDTRLSSGFSIFSRDQSKLYKLTDKTILGCSGCWCDILTFTNIAEARMKMYKQDHHKTMSTPAIAQMLSTMLYYKRFFPYYISNILAGLDEEGKGCVYSYDPVGHCGRSLYRAGGSSCALLQPLLDSQIGYKNLVNPVKVPLTREKAVTLVKDTFISAAERDIYAGDAVVIAVIAADGIKEEKFPLRRD